MARMADVEGNPGTWEVARELGKQLNIPVGPYEARVPTAAEMNAVLPYIMDRVARFAADKYFCENAEITLAHVLGINTPREGFPDSTGFCYRTGRDYEGYDRNGRDRNGYDRDGYDGNGRDREGYNRDGYDREGYDREGYDQRGRDYDGRTREEAVAALVGGWSDDFAAVIAAHVAKLQQPVAEQPAAKQPAARKFVAKKVAIV